MRKYYKCGEIKIIVKYTNNFTIPKYCGGDARPEYKITLISPEGKRVIITKWGNIADAPDAQCEDLARRVIAEVTTNPNIEKEFLLKVWRRKTLKIWRALTKRYALGYWQQYAKMSDFTNEPVLKTL